MQHQTASKKFAKPAAVWVIIAENCPNAVGNCLQKSVFELWLQYKCAWRWEARFALEMSICCWLLDLSWDLLSYTLHICLIIASNMEEGLRRKWMSFPEFMFLSLWMQLGMFRMLLFTEEDDDQKMRMENNFRPPQPIKGRRVRSSN